jgi:hypothetical protein
VPGRRGSPSVLLGFAQIDDVGVGVDILRCGMISVLLSQGRYQGYEVILPCDQEPEMMVDKGKADRTKEVGGWGRRPANETHETPKRFPSERGGIEYMP